LSALFASSVTSATAGLTDDGVLVPAGVVPVNEKWRA
jgi:hypothetical protein